MATLVKEKRREKKKSKQVHASKKHADLPALVIDTLETTPSQVVAGIRSEEMSEKSEDVESENIEQTSNEGLEGDTVELEKEIPSNIYSGETQKLHVIHESNLDNETPSITFSNLETNTNTLDRTNIKHDRVQSTDNIESISSSSLENNESYSKLYGDLNEEVKSLEIIENMVPSAPVLEQPESVTPETHPVIQHRSIEAKPRTQCMPLEEAIRVYGGKEIAEVKAMSEREEAIVEGGPSSGAEHPLVDLLSSFRLSLTAVERERAQISCNLIEEEKARSKLWMVQKRSISVSETCRCGANVDFKAVFDHAELLKEKLPAARMRLEVILRDVQESYCHHQHAALLAYCQIENLISETVESSKVGIREALSLVLQALRLSDGASEAYPHALRRWAGALAAALVDDRDLSQVLFLLHHLFRQTRSVRWASRIVRMSVTDTYSAARTIAVLDLLLARPGLETAVECTEELEAWEEVDRRGGAGAVGEGRLREQDLCALLAAMPLHALFARLTLFARSDIRTGSPLEWGDASGGHGVLKCCCGVRALLDVFARATHAHAAYTRLHDLLRRLAARLLHALAALHMHSSPLYIKELEERIHAELEACFVAGLGLGGALHQLPASLLAPPAAWDYCTTFMVGLHDTTPRHVDALRVDAPVLGCAMRVRVVTRAAVDRPTDHDLARTVLEFLFQTGMKRKSIACSSAGACETATREALASVLAAHRYLHTTAFELVADMYQAEPVEPSFVSWLCPGDWRPSPGEVRCVLDDWERRCPPLLPQLLMLLDYTPHEGLSLETQLSVGGWLCGRAARGEPAWCWAALRRLRVHRSLWHLPLEAPPPEEPPDLFSTAYALLSSAWGHCIPLACGPGAEALCRLAAARPSETLHCLDPMMRLMAQSPESVSYTPKFSETLSILLTGGPSLVARALGRAGPSPAERLQHLIVTQLTDRRFPESPGALLSAWMHALWKPALAPAARAALDAAVRACRQWSALDAHVAAMLQEENSKEYIADAMRNASTAPLLCEAMLRGAHAYEVRSHTHGRLLDALWRQRAAAQRIHVDNALKQIGAFMLADELVIHRSAAAVLSAPPPHPAHLTLWRLFFHIYLQRAPCANQETSIPIGPLFFNGIVKSRVLSHLKKRLQDTAAYHQKQTELLKTSSTTERPPERPARRDKTSPVVDTTMFPSLSIADLTGERANDESDGEEEGGTEVDVQVEPAREGTNDTFNMICYHSAAEKLVREYGRWLEEGEGARAAPHHADIARFIPEQALDAAWKMSITQVPLPESPTSPAAARHSEFKDTNALKSHYERAVDMLLAVKDNSHRKPRRTSVRSLLRDVSVHDARSLVTAVDKQLADLQKLAQDWSSEVRYISKLDAQLWDLVGALRVRRPLPPVSKSCAQGCKPTTVRIPEDEWCISTGAERGIQENRRSAHAALRRLARARPDAAHTAATLHAIARRIRTSEGAVRVAERAARCADGVEGCVLAKQALETMMAELAERWLCHDGAACASLIRSWSGGGAARQALCGALVAPRRLRPADWPVVYTAVLTAALPPHAAFSYLSKFEMSRWAETADAAQRLEVLEALTAAAQRAGLTPSDQHQVLLELLGVHACAVMTSQELYAQVSACARACVSRRLPPAYCAAIARAAEMHSARIPFDKLGHLQREVGAVWWEARTSGTVTSSYALYAEQWARLLSALQRAFVAAALAISYEPNAVGTFAWSSIRESWGPWVSPHSSPPLLPSTGEDEYYTVMLARFVDTLHQVMEQCPGSEESLLRQVWQWVVQTFLAVGGARGGEGGVQLSALLAELTRLPWNHQWFHVDCLQLALQAVSTGDKEVNAWCGQTWRGVAPATWVCGATADTLAPALAALLALFTSPHAQHTPQTLLEACSLPWARLPAAALDEGLDRFFMDHYNTTVPYHDAPQFIVVVSACELRMPAGVQPSPSALSREKRARGVSQWVRAAAAPALNGHVRAHSHAVLGVIAALAPYVQQSDELEELLSRAVVIMCMDAAAAALPVWEQWVAACGSRLRAACASAVGSLTHPDYFAALADAVAKAQLTDKEGTGWSELAARWAGRAGCAWVEGGALAARGALHAAYGALLARAHDARQLRSVLHALTAPDVRFDNEAIIAVWICVACRCAGGVAGAAGEEEAECRAAACALLTRWGAEPRRTLLQVVALQAATGPTPQHRLLCKLAQCIITPDEGAARAYEAACVSLLGPNAGDVGSWGRSPHPKRLPRLAARLYPDRELYFREELRLAPDSSYVAKLHL